MGDKADEHTPDAPMPARPGRGTSDLAGGPGDEPSRPDGAVLPEEEDEEELGDIAAEVQARVEAGQGRDDAPEYGSEGALGKPETGEW